MSSRSAYTALTPEYAAFPVPHTPLPSGLNPSSTRLYSEHEASISSVEDIPSLVHGWSASAKDVVQRNTGLLLFVASQAFLTLVNLAVKVLNSIVPSITELEFIAVRMMITYVCCVTYMALANIPDPIFGPKGVRLLLLFRGFIGFFGLFGIYYSLQYLSLSDATVLTFLAPMCTAMAGALFLGESFAPREAFAGIVSLVGVVLIARPTAIFGSASHPDSHVSVISQGVIDGQPTTPTTPEEKGTQAERLIAVGCIRSLYDDSCNWKASTSLAFSHLFLVYVDRCIYYRVSLVLSVIVILGAHLLPTDIRIIATKTPVVVPTRIDWLALLLLIGIFGFVAQILVTMAFQRETAGRSSMAIYTQIVLLIIVSAIYVVLTKGKQDTLTPKAITLVQLSQGTALEEGLLDYQREDGNKLDRNIRFGDDDSDIN